MKKIILATALLFISTISFAQEQTAQQISIDLSNKLCNQAIHFMAGRIAMNLRHSSDTSDTSLKLVYSIDTKKYIDNALNYCGASCDEIIDNLAMNVIAKNDVLEEQKVTAVINACHKARNP